METWQRVIQTKEGGVTEQQRSDCRVVQRLEENMDLLSPSYLLAL